MSRLILEFDDDDMRTAFLGQLSDGGIEDAIYEVFKSVDDISLDFDYSNAFPGRYRDESEDPIVKITVGK